MIENALKSPLKTHSDYSYQRFCKNVKKLVFQNRFTIDEIAKMTKRSVEECVEAFEIYTGKKLPATFLIAGNERQINELRKLILQKQKILLFGKNGVGKSTIPKKLAQELGWRIVYSYPTNNEELLVDFSELPLKTKNTIFVIEGDSFYWRSYGLINHYIKESKNPIIIIVDKSDKVHATVRKQLVTVKLSSPTREDVKKWVERKYPDWKGNINDVYDENMRVTLRNIKYGIKTYKPSKEEKLDAQQVAYRVIQGKATVQDFENCIHPFDWILSWIGYNAYTFYYGTDVQDLMSWIDDKKYNFKPDYLRGCLLNLRKPDKRGKLKFPPQGFKPKKEDEEDWIKEKRKIKKIKKEEPQPKVFKFAGDMEL